MNLRNRCYKLYNDLPTELGKYKRHVDVIDQIEAFAREVRAEALEDAAKLFEHQATHTNTVNQIRALKERAE